MYRALYLFFQHCVTSSCAEYACVQLSGLEHCICFSNTVWPEVVLVHDHESRKGQWYEERVNFCLSEVLLFFSSISWSFFFSLPEKWKSLAYISFLLPSHLFLEIQFDSGSCSHATWLLAIDMLFQIGDHSRPAAGPILESIRCLFWDWAKICWVNVNLCVWFLVCLVGFWGRLAEMVHGITDVTIENRVYISLEIESVLLSLEGGEDLDCCIGWN